MALGLAVVLAGAVAVAGILSGSTDSDQPASGASGPATPRPNASGPLTVTATPAPQAGAEQCSALLGALPAELPVPNGTLPRRQLAEPAPVGTAAWGGAEYDPVVLRCGVPRPASLVQTSQLTVVNGVSWLSDYSPAGVLWTVVDRPVYVAVNLPEASGTGPIQELSSVVRRTLPEQPVDPNR
ncbi:Protein of unknown function (DUF3515) [Streptoalloteichus tenebrarius]|uniref:DUF3515 domain-containing protein n=1 Tax=Streptoalloteichus tenebrarius (strain ATCC 17920 / DSM 40477 / JCM 4838 / CBS 697.72 / NBRC 16177 / NCIMB 11028 / NRRL B-12390 / A12253. 1 / ISP 5477) TaxID=1933 RepID=A0ABT1HZJ7_STRSD|nr:Protein of unknown function (DUF3515) [Streptoalloteichus tenebrarius]